MNDINQSIQFRNRLLSVLSHEAKGLLANVFWMIEIIENGLDNDSIKNLLPELKAIAGKNSDELNGVLQWIKAQQSVAAIHSQEIDLNSLFIELKNLFGEQLLRKNVQLAYDAGGCANIHSDYQLLKLVLKNIVEYAVKISDNQKKILVTCVGDIEQNQIEIIFQNIDAQHISDDFNLSFAKEITLLINGEFFIHDRIIKIVLPYNIN